MDAMQNLAVVAVGVGTLPIAAGIARCALGALFSFVLEAGEREQSSLPKIPEAAVTAF